MSRSANRAIWAFVGVAVGWLLASVPAPAWAQDPPSYYVLCVGINRYESPHVSDLQGAVNDANGIEKVFKEQGPRVRVRMLVDADAATHKIMGALKTMEEEVEPGEIVVVYLSGHGRRHRGEWQFAPYDYGGGGVGILDSIVLGPINTLIHRGHRVLLMIDACHAGQIAHNPGVENHMLGKKFYQTEGDGFFRGGLILMAACAPSQTSKDGADNGVFTKALLEALRGRADLDQDGTVTLKEVKTYLFWRVNELGHRQWKYPGMAWPAEQDYVCVASNSIPETFVMTRVEGSKPLLPWEEFTVRRPYRLEVAPGPSPVGLWRQAQTVKKGDGSPLLDANGRPGQLIYELDLREDGTYAASLTVSGGVIVSAQTTQGHYSYQPNSVFNFGPDGRRRNPYFSLDFDNGFDSLGLESLTEQEMRIEAYPSPSDQPPRKYTLTRVGKP